MWCLYDRCMTEVGRESRSGTTVAEVASTRNLALTLRLFWVVGAVGLAAGAPGLRLPIGFGLVALVAYANGANDISKSIATLVGSGVANYRKATAWGTAATAAGASVSVVTGAALAAAFSTRLLSVGTVIGFAFALAAIAGTAGWVLLASRVGLPVSTTHALAGSIVAAGIATYGAGGVQWGVIGSVVALPLLLSPLLGLLLSVGLITLAKAAHLRDRSALRPVHWAASGMTAFARGLNDAPKIAALGTLLVLATSGATPSGSGLVAIAAIVAVAMALGSYVGGRRVIATLATRVTRIDDLDGTAANVVTAALVTFAATHGLPVSTTHVSSGSIFGIGIAARDGRLDVNVVRGLLMAWLVTVPGAGLIAVGAWAVATVIVGAPVTP